MNLGHLAIFLAVAEEKNISRGARRLMISQPAVSKQIQLLERHLGTALLERNPRGVRPTRAGELLADYARRIFALESEAERVVREHNGLRRGRLSIGASTTAGVYLLPEVFVQFRQEHPAIEAALQVADSSTIHQHVRDGLLDVGFTETPPAFDHLDMEEFTRDSLVAIARPDHPLLKRAKVSAGMFCKEPFIVRSTGSDTRSFVERALSERGLSVTPIMSLGTTEAIKRAVAAGIGVAIVSRLSIGLELKARRLAEVKVQGLSISRPLYQVRRRRSPSDPAFEAFRSLLRKHCLSLR